MPAPKNPNTAAATAAAVRRGQETAAAKLRAAGWTVTPPPAGRPATASDRLRAAITTRNAAEREIVAIIRAIHAATEETP